MQLLLIQRILGLFLIVFSSTQIPPMLVSIIYADGALVPFFDAFSITLITGIVMWLPVKNVKRELRMRDGFLVVVMFWTVLGLFGSIPFIMSELVPISITDAVFESISGLTTTGATVLSGLDTLPKSILYYRQQLQWLGVKSGRPSGSASCRRCTIGPVRLCQQRRGSCSVRWTSCPHGLFSQQRI